MAKQTQATSPLPHDWTFSNWPAGVYPYDGLKARHVVRQNIDELMRCGALARPGHRIIIFGAGYAKWLASKAARVIDDYSIAPNEPEHAHKRGGPAGEAARAKAGGAA